MSRRYRIFCYVMLSEYQLFQLFNEKIIAQFISYFKEVEVFLRDYDKIYT